MAMSVLKQVIFSDEQHIFGHVYVCSGSDNKLVLYKLSLKKS